MSGKASLVINQLLAFDDERIVRISVKFQVRSAEPVIQPARTHGPSLGDSLAVNEQRQI
jgi:hypothetical protein